MEITKKLYDYRGKGQWVIEEVIEKLPTQYLMSFYDRPGRLYNEWVDHEAAELARVPAILTVIFTLEEYGYCIVQMEVIYRSFREPEDGYHEVMVLLHCAGVGTLTEEEKKILRGLMNNDAFGHSECPFEVGFYGQSVLTIVINESY